jgi:hypothetical protein
MNNSILDLIGSFSSPSHDTSPFQQQQQQQQAKQQQPQQPQQQGHAGEDVHAQDEKAGNVSCLPSTYSAVIFSKDRPFQLYTLLHSMRAFLSPAPRSTFVIYTSSPEWVPHYAAVFAAYSDTVCPILETVFSRDIDECFARIFSDAGNGHVMHCVDDLVFYNQVSFRSVHACCTLVCVMPACRYAQYVFECAGWCG